MSTKPPKSPFELALAGVPAAFRSKISSSFFEIKKRSREGKLDAAGLSAGKFCEAVLRLLQQEVKGSFTPFGRQIPNFADVCREIISGTSATVPESLRVIVPRALVFVYTMRSKRGIGHVGGDVDANGIDLATMVRVVDWIVCELIRHYHGLSLEEAQDIVDNLALREIPDIWEVGGRKRVLRDGLSKQDEALLLLYSETARSIPAEDLLSWTRFAGSMSMFRARVLTPLDRSSLVDVDDDALIVTLSPKGEKEVETRILPGAA
jgi:hypothetical protein